jgi:hypothetical protein
MRLRAAILGQSASRSDEGRASLSDVLHHVSTESLPAICSLGLLCVFDAEAGDSGRNFNIAVNILSPEGLSAQLFADVHHFRGDYLPDGI